MAAWAAVLFAFSACQDVVEVEDLKAKDDIPSNGAPEITKIVLANDKEFEIDGADFEDMVRIEGKNLGNVVSVKFNDVEVDPKEIYARYGMLLAPVPRQLPGEVTDMLYITTKNGSVSRPFTVYRRTGRCAHRQCDLYRNRRYPLGYYAANPRQRPAQYRPDHSGR